MALPPIIGSRLSPPVDSIGDKQLERARRDFMDLLKSDERRHESDQRREHRERQQAADEVNRAEADRRETSARLVPAANARNRPVQRPNQMLASLQRTRAPANAPLSAPLADRSPAPSAAATRRTDSLMSASLAASPATASAAGEASATRIAPAERRAREPGEAPRDTSAPAARQPARAPDGAAPQPRMAPAPMPALPPVPRREWPQPPPGSSLVAAAPEASSLNLIAKSSENASFRLSSETPPEVAERIARFMRTGMLDRRPFGFAQVDPVVERARRPETQEEKADRAVAALISEAAPHMRRSMEVSSLAPSERLSAAPLPPEQIAARVAAVAALQRRPDGLGHALGGGAPLTLVASSGTLVPAIGSSDAPPARDAPPVGEANPFFSARGADALREREEDEHVIDILAGPRVHGLRDRIA